MSDDIVDRIGELVDGQLAGGEHANLDVCWHCGRTWHGLPITERVHQMWRRGEYDPSYRVNTDTSAVVCQGSDFIGPMPFHEANLYVYSEAEIRVALSEAISEIERDLNRQLDQFELEHWRTQWVWSVRILALSAFGVGLNLLILIWQMPEIRFVHVFNVAAVIVLLLQTRRLCKSLRRLKGERPDNADRPSYRECFGWGCWRRLVRRNRRRGSS